MGATEPKVEGALEPLSTAPPRSEPGAVLTEPGPEAGVAMREFHEASEVVPDEGGHQSQSEAIRGNHSVAKREFHEASEVVPSPAADAS